MHMHNNNNMCMRMHMHMCACTCVAGRGFGSRGFAVAAGTLRLYCTSVCECVVMVWCLVTITHTRDTPGTRHSTHDTL